MAKDPRCTSMKPPYMKPLPAVRGCTYCAKFHHVMINGVSREACKEGKTFDKRFPYASIPVRCVDRGWFVRRTPDEG